MICTTAKADLISSATRHNWIEDIPAPPLDNRESGMTDEWPLRSFIELGAYTGAVRCARLHAQLVLREWGFTGLSDTCAQVISELVTNSVQASEAAGEFTTVRLWLFSDKEKVLILVWDGLPQPPAPRTDVDELAESGRGLLLVSIWSEQWSWYPFPAGGKVVWALCSEAFR